MLRIVVVVAALVVTACTAGSAVPSSAPSGAGAAVAQPTAASSPTRADTAVASLKLLASVPDKYWTIGTVAAFKEAKTAGALIIDVRDQSEYAAGHIPGAVNIPYRTLASNLDKIPADRTVVVYCASNYRAGIATAALQMLGYANVRDFTVTFKGWQTAKEAISTEPVAATSAGPSRTDGALVAAVDAWLKAVPNNNYGIGTVAALKDAQTAGLTVVDVREPTEYAAGHIPGALNVPIRDLGKDTVKLPKDKQIAVYCSTNHRAGMSLVALRMMGYADVRGFTLSYAGWTAAGEAVAK